MTTAIVATLFFACGMCGKTAGQRLVRVRRWFTLFFLPIFPFGHGKYVVCCAYCGRDYPLTRENAEQFIIDAQVFEAERVAAAAAGFDKQPNL